MNPIVKTTRMLCAPLLLCAVFGAARAQQLYEPPATEEQAAARALAERRQKMIEECQQNFGSEIDCTREVDTELRAEALQSGGRVIHLRPPH
jgi:hypothetical protein